MKHGYSQIERDGKAKYIHRWAYELWIGPIPDGLNVLHSCDNPSCFNPDHLFCGTQKANVDDAMSKGRMVIPRGEQNGMSKLTARDVKTIRASNESSAVLGMQFGLHRRSIWRIRANKGWQHIN